MSAAMSRLRAWWRRERRLTNGQIVVYLAAFELVRMLASVAW